MLKQLLFSCLLLLSNIALADIQITDSHGKYIFKTPPDRVVVLNWTLAEQMLELDIIPVGMAGIADFKSTNKQLVVPNNVVDVGSRLSPDLKKIKELSPDIIVIGYSQRPLTHTLSNIATVIYFKNFGNRYNNQAKAKSRYLELAKLFDKQDLAERKLSTRQEQIAELKKRISEKFVGKIKPKLQFLVPPSQQNSEQVWVFGKNSMPYYAAKELGLELVAIDDTDAFGVSRTNLRIVEELNTSSDSQICQLYLSSYSSAQTKSPKFDGCGGELSYQNAFGGIFSIYNLAESISKVVLRK